MDRACRKPSVRLRSSGFSVPAGCFPALPGGASVTFRRERKPTRSAAVLEADCVPAGGSPFVCAVKLCRAAAEGVRAYPSAEPEVCHRLATEPHSSRWIVRVLAVLEIVADEAQESVDGRRGVAAAASPAPASVATADGARLLAPSDFITIVVMTLCRHDMVAALTEVADKDTPLVLEAQSVFATAALASLVALAERGYAHGDVSPEQFLCCDNGSIVLADFGQCVPTLTSMSSTGVHAADCCRSWAGTAARVLEKLERMAAAGIPGPGSGEARHRALLSSERGATSGRDVASDRSLASVLSPSSASTPKGLVTMRDAVLGHPRSGERDGAIDVAVVRRGGSGRVRSGSDDDDDIDMGDGGASAEWSAASLGRHGAAEAVGFVPSTPHHPGGAESSASSSASSSPSQASARSALPSSSGHVWESEAPTAASAEMWRSGAAAEDKEERGRAVGAASPVPQRARSLKPDDLPQPGSARFFFRGKTAYRAPEVWIGATEAAAAVSSGTMALDPGCTCGEERWRAHTEDAWGLGATLFAVCFKLTPPAALSVHARMQANSVPVVLMDLVMHVAGVAGTDPLLTWAVMQEPFESGRIRWTSPQGVHLIVSLMTPDVRFRMRFSTMARHPFLKPELVGVRRENLEARCTRAEL